MPCSFDHYAAMGEVNKVPAAKATSFTRPEFDTIFDTVYSLAAQVGQKGMRIRPSEMITIASAIHSPAYARAGIRDAHAQFQRHVRAC